MEVSRLSLQVLEGGTYGLILIILKKKDIVLTKKGEENYFISRENCMKLEDILQGEA